MLISIHISARTSFQILRVRFAPKKNRPSESSCRRKGIYHFNLQTGRPIISPSINLRISHTSSIHQLKLFRDHMLEAAEFNEGCNFSYMPIILHHMGKASHGIYMKEQNTPNHSNFKKSQQNKQARARVYRLCTKAAA